MDHLPLDERGYPVPWFVDMTSGKPDFRVIRPSGIALAHNNRLCWLCGQKLGRYLAFVAGPMCGINRVSAEPPSHRECAEYAARACPFLTRPLAVRNERDMPEHTPPSGVMLKRNPGVALVWITKSYRPFRVDAVGGGRAGSLFRLGDPTHVDFYCKGRPATRAEVEHSVATGFHELEDVARLQGSDAVRALRSQRAAFDKIVIARCAEVVT